MTKRQRAQKGAVSVLVVITMLMLIVFGLLALTSALAFERLGKKTVTWTGEYYELDSMASDYVQLIDESLFNAEKAAREYIMSGAYSGTSSPYDIPQAGQGEIARRFGTAYSDAGKERALEAIFERVYFFYSVRELKKLSNEDGFLTLTLKEPFISEDNFLTVWSRAPEAGDVMAEFLVSEGEGEGFKNISIAVTVAPAKVNLHLSGAAVTGGREATNLKRYRIVTWYEWQKELTMRDTPFWDGQFDTLPDFDLLTDAPFEIDDTLPE